MSQTPAQLTWNKAQLLSEVGAFDWTAAATLNSASWRSYLDFFALPQASSAITHQAGVLHCANFDLMLQAWSPKEPCATAYLVHGLHDHVGLYRHLIHYCLAHNWRVVAFDLPGHGLSSGKANVIDSFQRYDQVFTEILHSIQQHYAEPIRVFGQSTGGAIIINYLLKNAVKQSHSPFVSVHLIAPLIRPREWKKLFLLPVLKPFKTEIKRGKSLNSHDQDFLNLVWHQDPLQAKALSMNWALSAYEWMKFIEKQKPSDVPVQIAQGDDDRTVAWKKNLKVLKEKFPKQKLFLIANGRHHLVNESAEIRQKMWDFFDQENA
ncbi:MAG: hypothetical protein RL217_1327 [Pseudomonadota bacterium]